MKKGQISERVSRKDGLESNDTLKNTTGVVVDCFKLNVRKESTTASDIVAVVPEGTKLVIDVGNSTVSWYAVLLDGDKSGFVMKQFVKVKD